MSFISFPVLGNLGLQARQPHNTPLQQSSLHGPGSSLTPITFSSLARSRLSSILLFSNSTSSLVPLSTMMSSSWKAAPHWRAKGRSVTTRGEERRTLLFTRGWSSALARLWLHLCQHLRSAQLLSALAWEVHVPAESSIAWLSPLPPRVPTQVSDRVVHGI